MRNTMINHLIDKLLIQLKINKQQPFAQLNPNIRHWFWMISSFMITSMAVIGVGYAYAKHLQQTTPAIINPPKHLPFASLETLQQQGVFADKVYVQKSTRTMQLLHQGQVIRQYNIALGANPKGHKQQEGDDKTPEGWYTLDYKNDNSMAYRSIHISYPNAKDLENAKSKGVKAGGEIMIHGQMNGYEHLTKMMQKWNWTDGCVAVTNHEMDEIMALVNVGTPIHIEW